MSGPIKPQDRLAWHRQLTRDPKLSHVAIHVGVVISNHFNNGSGRTFVSVATIAREVGRHPRTVQRAIRTLAKAGHLNVIAGGGRAKACTYEMPHVKKDGTGVAHAHRNHSTNCLKGDTGVTPTLSKINSSEPARSLATAPCEGALTREPGSEPAEPKQAAEQSRPSLPPPGQDYDSLTALYGPPRSRFERKAPAAPKPVKTRRAEFKWRGVNQAAQRVADRLKEEA